MQRAFAQVDVFTAEPYLGNPVAVVLDGGGLTTGQMQRVAAWTNLSETTFVLPPSDPGADYRVRIFTPSAELPFAGHPTIGTCHAWLEAGGVPAGPGVVQECAAGLVRLRREAGRLAFAAPPLRRHGPVDETTRARLARVLGLPPEQVADAEWTDNGPGWVTAWVDDPELLLAVEAGPLEGLHVGLVGPARADAGAALEVRAFFGVGGRTVEDPVTGSLNAGVVDWLVRTGRVRTPYVARQGTVLGRRGLVHVGVADGSTWVGGDAVTCVTGTLEA